MQFHFRPPAGSSDSTEQTAPGDLREQRSNNAVLALTEMLVGNCEVSLLLRTLVEHVTEIFGFAAAGVITKDGPRPEVGRQSLSVAAASSEPGRFLEAVAVAVEDGPCIDCLRTARTVICSDLAADGPRRWPSFAAAATRVGIRAAHAIPMRSGEGAVGALTLLHDGPYILDQRGARLGQALADVGAIAIGQQRLLHRAQGAEERLAGELTSRITIERANGVLAALTGVEPHYAAAILRHHAQAHRLDLIDLAKSVIDRTIDPSDIADLQ